MNILRINNNYTKTPECSYVSGWFNNKLFEFHYFYETGEFHFGTTTFIDGRYVSCELLSEHEQKILKNMWLYGENS